MVERLKSHLPKAQYPVRVGTHFNTAFALLLAADYAQATFDPTLTELLRDKAQAWYGADCDCQAWEPGGDDFLSPALVEAACMLRLLPSREFRTWFDGFLPGIGGGRPATLFLPAGVTDRSDGKLAHLDGLNLSRAWCWSLLAGAFDAGDPRRDLALAAAEIHRQAALPHLTEDYMGEHWLATFAILALEQAEPIVATRPEGR